MAKSKPMTQRDIDLAAFMYEQGRSSLEIGHMLARPPQTIRAAIKRVGVVVRPLSDVNVRDIFDRRFFEAIDTETKAYWLGFLSADGSVGKRHSITITLQPRDAPHLKEFLSAIHSEKVPRPTKSGYAQISLSSAEMVADLARWHVVNNKTLKLRMPPLASAMQRHYLRGYIDGDGCIAHYPRGRGRRGFSTTLRITSNAHFLKSAGTILADRCEKPYGTFDEGHGIGTIYWSQRQAIQHLLHFLYDGATVCLERKFKIAQEIMALEPVLRRHR